MTKPEPLVREGPQVRMGKPRLGAWGSPKNHLERVRVSHNRSIIGGCLLIGLVVLAGCAADNHEEPVVVKTQAAATTDEDICRAFSDVLTITVNADAGLRDGRMAQQEQLGWYRLATRELDHIPTNGDGAVSDALGALKSAAPPIILGALLPTGIGTADWDMASADLSSACIAAGFEEAVEAFTGG